LEKLWKNFGKTLEKLFQIEFSNAALQCSATKKNLNDYCGLDLKKMRLFDLSKTKVQHRIVA
jgi:hypothetical protein